MINFNKNFGKTNANIANNVNNSSNQSSNLDMQKMVEILSKLDKNQLEQGMAKAQEILNQKRNQSSNSNGKK